MKELIISIDKAYSEVMDLYKTIWKADLDQMCSLMDGMCPAWMPVRETMLSNDEVCKALLANTENYGKIGPLANEMKAQIAFFNSIRQDSLGYLVPKTDIEKCRTACTLGVETLGFTFVIHHIRNEFPGK